MPAADRATQGLPLRVSDPVDYGFADLAATDRPHDLYEAARRGTPAAAARMIGKARREGIDRTDPYHMSPLAWAVIRLRPELAERLLAAGASRWAGAAMSPASPKRRSA